MRRICTILGVLLALAASLYAWNQIAMDDPIPKLLANSAVDIVSDGQYVWVGTTKGLSGTRDGGASWIGFDTTNGLSAREISALAARDGVVWAGLSHSIISQGQSIPLGDGFNATTDAGNSFTESQPSQASSAGMLAYDIELGEHELWAACFYGGLIYSFDNGATWENLFPDTLARNDFVNRQFTVLNNRFFSVALDKDYDDTTVVWAGSAEGINRFEFIQPGRKLAGNLVLDFAHGGGYTWIATDRGLSRTDNKGVSYRSYFKADGLTADYISAVAASDEIVICAGFVPETDSSAGFAFSTDDGATWNQSYPAEAVGPGRKVEDLSMAEGTIWAACTGGALIRSADGGQTWTGSYVHVEPLPPGSIEDSEANRYYSVAFYRQDPDTAVILGGTGKALMLYYYTDLSGDIRRVNSKSFDGLPVAGRKVIDIATAPLAADTVEWAIATVPNEGAGQTAILRSTDQGDTWNHYQNGNRCYQLTYSDDVIWAATEDGLFRYRRNFDDMIPIDIIDPVKQISLSVALRAASFDTADTALWIGSVDGVASTPNAAFWDIDTVQFDPKVFDSNIRTIAPDSGLLGNFVTALEVQRFNGQRVIWAATNSTGTSTQSSGICFSVNDGLNWQTALSNVQAWNFAFDDSLVYAATSDGLYKIHYTHDVLEKLQVIDTAGGTQVYPPSEYFGVGVIDGVLWAASDDGIARSPDQGDSWTIYRTFKSIPEQGGTRVFASPVPSSPYSSPGGRVKFHYRFKEAGNVTVSVYDFAMNLVATPVRAAPREGGVQHDNDTWDMRNDDGRIVATGVYYFKVESSSGEEEWGKVMVIP